MIMTLRNSVSGYQHCEGLHSLHLQCHGINRQTHKSTDLDEIVATVTSYDLKFSLIREGGTLLVGQLVDALRYKPEGRGFHSQWCH
jgi:hypothetical protein